MKNTIIALTLMLGVAVQAHAIPTLQLDISGGTYDAATQTIVAAGNTFTLYAYLTPDSGNLLTDTYFLSAAVIPKQAQTVPAPDLGSFSLNSTAISVTGDMIYGIPPVEILGADFDAGDLGRHGIFDTYFKEFSFTFTSSDHLSPYNTQDRAINGTSIDLSGSGMYFAAFTVDVSSLEPGYGIHFDLYNSELAKRCPTDLDVSGFAPYSHDAEGWYHDPPIPPNETVPEPATLLLLGGGLIGLAFFGRRRVGK